MEKTVVRKRRGYRAEGGVSKPNYDLQLISSSWWDEHQEQLMKDGYEKATDQEAKDYLEKVQEQKNAVHETKVKVLEKASGKKLVKVVKKDDKQNEK